MNVSRNKIPKLTTDQASQMLQNIYEVCQIEPNTVPLSTLEEYSNYRAERFTFKKLVLIIIMLGFLAIPFLFLAPEMTVTSKPVNNTSPRYEIAVHSLLPIKSVTASLDGTNIPVYETDNHIYSVDPTKSGTITVTATTVNKQINTITKDVKVIQKDTTPPSLVKSATIDSSVYLYIKDEDSGIDYSSIYGQDANGNRIEPRSYNSKDGYVVFGYPESKTKLYVSDKDGNTLQLTLSAQ